MFQTSSRHRGILPVMVRALFLVSRAEAATEHVLAIEDWGEVPCDALAYLTSTLVGQWAQDGCSIADYRWVREDSDPIVTDAGQPVAQLCAKMTIRRCPPCCDEGCGDLGGASQVSQYLSATQDRTLTVEVGAEVGVSGGVGIPFLAKAEVEASLRSSLGQSGSLSVEVGAQVTDGSAHCTVSIWEMKSTISENAKARVLHTYRLEVLLAQALPTPEVPNPIDCSVANQWIPVVICPTLRESRVSGEDWRVIETVPDHVSLTPCP